MTEPTTVTKGRHYPVPPPALKGETDEQYTDRLTGADRSGDSPYDHRRNRQCSISYHDECSDPAGESCECPCHKTEAPAVRHDDPAVFALVRDEDLTGTSGTGRVASGVQFRDGSVALRWETERTSTAIYSSIRDVVEIHGHGGKTRLVWIWCPDRAPDHSATDTQGDDASA